MSGSVRLTEPLWDEAVTSRTVAEPDRTVATLVVFISNSLLLHDNYLLLNRQRREYHVFEALLQIIPGLEASLMNGSESDIIEIVELVCLVVYAQLGASSFLGSAQSIPTGQRSGLV
jgi:hypothetical protein